METSKNGVNIEPVTASPFGGTPGGPWKPPPSPDPPPPRQASQGPSRTLAIAALITAIAAIGVAVGAWLKPTTSASTSYVDVSSAPSEREIADANTALCKAHELVGRATQTAASRKSEDPAITYIVATNVRLGATASADYLLEKVADNPAASPGLLDSIKALAVTYQEVTLLHLANANDAELDVTYNQLDKHDAEVAKACL